MTRSSGVLLHIASLPGSYAIGDLGYEAEKFAAFIKKSGFSVWQVLPTTPVAPVFGNSPYCSSSAFAGNFLFISPDKLYSIGLLSKDDIWPLSVFSNSHADYERASEIRIELLAKAWKRFKSEKSCAQLRSECDEFRSREKFWLEDYALFSFFKKKFEGIEWQKWPGDVKHRNFSEETLSLIEEERDKIDFVVFVQFIFAEQWKSLRMHCKSLGIEIMGDMPMFTASDSADVWAHPELFDLDSEGLPSSVAGVPPDYFSTTGQRWGNPVYLWNSRKSELFEWWKVRISSALNNFDIIRIDHFRGFSAYWSIPSNEETADNGRWISAPGRALLEYLRESLCEEGHNLPLVAEDLGVITDDVTALMDDFKLPGMKVLLFAFGGDVGKNPYAPHNIDRNSVTYTGTHDNNTVLGWWCSESSAGERLAFKTYCGHNCSGSEAASAMVTLALMSSSDLAVIPMQDILGLGGESRMNIPGTASGNWVWRMSDEDFRRATAEKSPLSMLYREKNTLYGRFCG